MRQLLSLLAFLLSTTSAFGQATTAKVLGSVTDPSSAIVTGAKVDIRNTQTGVSRTTTTDQQGNYEFNFLPVGTYTLEVEAAGFQKSAVSAFAVSVDQTA